MSSGVALGRRAVRALELTRSEVAFMALLTGLGVVVGATGLSGSGQLGLALIIWSGLVGMWIPRILDASRGVRRVSADEQRQEDARAEARRMYRHDVASALLSIEGGICALRLLNHSHEPEIEAVTHAIETETRRIRRLSLTDTPRGDNADVLTTVEPVLALYRAGGMNLEAALDPARLDFHSDHLARVLSNLLDNCTVHAPGSAVRLFGEVDESGTRYRLRVSDDGPGVPPELGARVLDRDVSSRAAGGLGLYSVRTVVEQAGGAVSLDSGCTGAAFEILLPLGAVDRRDGHGTPYAPRSCVVDELVVGALA